MKSHTRTHTQCGRLHTIGSARCFFPYLDDINTDIEAEESGWETRGSFTIYLHGNKLEEMPSQWLYMVSFPCSDVEKLQKDMSRLSETQHIWMLRTTSRVNLWLFCWSDKENPGDWKPLAVFQLFPRCRCCSVAVSQEAVTWHLDTLGLCTSVHHCTMTSLDVLTRPQHCRPGRGILSFGPLHGSVLLPSLCLLPQIQTDRHEERKEHEDHPVSFSFIQADLLMSCIWQIGTLPVVTGLILL